ncbi:leucine-rich repeat-containing protein 24-like [Pollicipes pollicipes]|uniref:leucine-rich repeat-containing protein 24-like n=1 Tax=Pollicipes pollicipes TaxID=41117 RepID=UPI001884F2F5|nr:leucine-rich repeat-containing protein 24-like [Pollicipes pollicipes]
MRRGWLPVLALVALALVAPARGAKCPNACSCRWKYGKQTVECRASRLRAVPEGLDPGTQVLDLSENQLDELPAEVFRRAGLLNLQKILLADCRLRRVDDAAFSGLTNLVYLDLSDNALTALPKRSFGAVGALRELKAAANPIRRVDEDTFAAVPGLVKLDLGGCQIGEVEPAAFDPLRIIESLKLSSNRLRELPERAVVALDQLHNVELHANPWECDCRLRPMRDWLRRNNIPYPVPPSCHGPPRLAGRSFEELGVNEFACRPQLLPMVREVVVTADENATLTCRIGAVPQARLSWLWRGRPVDNNTLLDGGRRPVIVEEGRFERVSRLVIPGVRAEDAAADVRCVGVNPAGDAQTNFTLTVGARLAFLSPLSDGQIAGIAVGLLLLVAVMVAALVTVARTRSANAKESKPRPPVDGRGVVVSVETAPDDDVNPLEKPPRLTELGFPPRYSTSTGSIVESAVFVRAPDLLPTADAATPPPSAAYPPYYAGGVTGNPLADDSYELQQLPSTSGSDPERLDPAAYGYPADYGLPMPELGVAGWDDRRISVQQEPFADADWAGRRLSGAPSRREPSTSSEADAQLDSSRDSRAELARATFWVYLMLVCVGYEEQYQRF